MRRPSKFKRIRKEKTIVANAVLLQRLEMLKETTSFTAKIEIAGMRVDTVTTACQPSNRKVKS
jgi:hypothetical protein